MKKVFNKQINEHLTSNDLRWLVDDSILIDMHKTKMGADKDYIVLSIAVNDRTPAHDLARFIENSVYKPCCIVTGKQIGRASCRERV